MCGVSKTLARAQMPDLRLCVSGPQHDVDRLSEVLSGKMLSSWQEQAESLQAKERWVHSNNMVSDSPAAFLLQVFFPSQHQYAVMCECEERLSIRHLQQMYLTP